MVVCYPPLHKVCTCSDFVQVTQERPHLSLTRKTQVQPMRKRRSNKKNPVERDNTFHPPIAKRRLLRQNLQVYEDRRFHYPSPVRPVFAEPRYASRLVIPDVSFSDRLKQLRHLNRNNGSKSYRENTISLTPRIAFAEPKRVAVCVRRHRRREVLHALGIAGGKGAGLHRKRRRNEWSDVSC